jgi:hypothetical protein
MAKKCIPGVICIENITLALLVFIIIVLGYMYYSFVKNDVLEKPQSPVFTTPFVISTRHSPNVILDPYGPPLKNDGIYFPNHFSQPDVLQRGVPVNIQTRGLSQDYTQMGILTRDKDDLILCLMGRRLMSGLDKWQYYTISNTGNMNTKLPISVRGKSCSGEYGCDPLMNGDSVFVEGYKDVFKATIYENSTFSYIPYI